MVTKIVGSPLLQSRTSSATIRIRWSAIWLSRSVVGTARAAEATRSRPPRRAAGAPSDRRARLARRPSSMRATSRALRPRSDASFLNWSISSMTKIGIDDLVVGELEDRARVVNQNVRVENEVFHAPLRSLGLLRLAARDGDLLDDDVGVRLVARAALDAGDLGDQRQRLAQAEDRVAAGEVLGRPLGDEELRAVGAPARRWPWPAGPACRTSARARTRPRSGSPGCRCRCPADRRPGS